MLIDFFELDPNQNNRNMDEVELAQHFGIANDIRNVSYTPGAWPDELRKVEGKNFKNVRLSHTTFSRITLLECTFTDCLLIGCVFESVQFHRCKFINCNFYKSTFVKCYIDPSSFFLDPSYMKTASNIGVDLFHRLMENSSKEKQYEFEQIADIKFREWKRAQLSYDKKKGKIGKFEFLLKYSSDLIYQTSCGYGYEPFRFLIVMVILFLLLSLINFSWMSGNIQNNSGVIGSVNIVDSMFYTFL